MKTSEISNYQMIASMSKYPVFLLILFLTACNLGGEDACIPINGELTESNLEVPQALYQQEVGFTLSYDPGDCTMLTSFWTVPGSTDEKEGTFQFEGEATFGGAFRTSGEVCVRISSGESSSNTICQPLEVVREDVWGITDAGRYPGSATNRNITLALRDGIYCGFGEQNEWYSFDPDSWEWSEKSTLSFVGFEAFAGFEINKVAYILGQNGFVYRYDEAGDTWTDVGEFTEGDVALTFDQEQWSNTNDATNFLHPFVGAAINGKGYIGVGGNGRFFEFDPSTGLFTELASYPIIGLEDANYFVWQGKLYLGPYRYDPATDQWEDAPSRYSFDQYDRFFAVQADGVYFLSGNTTFRFDGSTTTAYEPRSILAGESRIPSGITQGATFDGLTFFPKYFSEGRKVGLFQYFIKN